MRLTRLTASGDPAPPSAFLRAPPAADCAEGARAPASATAQTAAAGEAEPAPVQPPAAAPAPAAAAASACQAPNAAPALAAPGAVGAQPPAGGAQTGSAPDAVGARSGAVSGATEAAAAQPPHRSLMRPLRASARRLPARPRLQPLRQPPAAQRLTWQSLKRSPAPRTRPRCGSCFWTSRRSRGGAAGRRTRSMRPRPSWTCPRSTNCRWGHWQQVVHCCNVTLVPPVQQECYQVNLQKGVPGGDGGGCYSV